MDENRIAIARDVTSEHFEADQLSFHALFLLLRESLPANELALHEFHNPSKPGFEQRGRSVHVVSVKKHSRFEPQRVSRSQSSRNQTSRAARFQYGIPNGFGMNGGKIEFKAVFTSVSGARNNCIRARDLRSHEVVVGNR